MFDISFRDVSTEPAVIEDNGPALSAAEMRALQMAEMGLPGLMADFVPPPATVTPALPPARSR